MMKIIHHSGDIMSGIPSTSPAEQEPEEAKTEIFRGLIKYERQSPVRQISYYISGNILESHYYTELFYTLRTAIETDIIYLHLNTSGGDFDTGLQIINNMQASSANVVTVLEARAYSMGAFILAGDEFIVHDNCQLLFHIYSGSFAGRGNEQQAEVLAVSNWFEKFMTRTCLPFLSAAEIKDVLKGSDVWMDSDEIRRRLERIRRAQMKLLKTSKQKISEE
jgi:ATP-dependent Clp protease, protease subunit